MNSSISNQDNGKPEWLESFLKTTFFGSCTIHEAPENELKKYCIDCHLPACLHCIDASSHAGHKVLKINKYVTKGAVPVKEIKEHIDCSKIQSYRWNKKMVLALTPVPHSCSETNAKAACNTCMRKLSNPRAYRYCCIACKVQAFSEKTNDFDPPFLAIRKSSHKRKPKRSRKGVPRRAPAL